MFDWLISWGGRRTLLYATVNTIQAGIRGGSQGTDNISSKNKEKVSIFYQALEKTFDLQFGKILLAVSSKDQLQFMLDQSWPVFANLTVELGLCLNGTRCTQITEAIQTLGGFCFG